VPERAQERERHAAADERARPPREQVLDQRDLVGDLGAAEHGDQRARGRLEDAPSASSSRSMSRAAAAGWRWRVMASIEAWARCAAAKASLT
jgi:hypothetical protein